MAMYENNTPPLADFINRLSTGLLPRQGDPRSYPVGIMGLGMGGQQGKGGTAGRNTRNASNTSNGYTPQDVLKSQQSIADWFQSRPPAAGTAAGNVGTAGNAFMGTFIPTRAEERMRENERIEADAVRQAMEAPTREGMYAALSRSGPRHRDLAVGGRLEDTDPLRGAQIDLAKAQARAATRSMELEDNLFGGGPGAQGPAAAPPQQWPDLTGVRPDANTNQGIVVQPPEAPQQPPFPGRMNLGGPVPQPEGAENMVLPAQALMEQSLQAAERQGGQQPTAPAPATAPNSMQSARDMFLALSPIDQAQVKAQYKKDPAKAVQMIQQLADPRGAQANVIDRESAEAQGKAQGTARSNLPTALQTANSMIRNLDTVIDDPNRENVTGWQAADWYANPSGPGQPHLFGIPLNPLAYTPTAPSTETSRERIRQVQGQAFMQAYQAIRGAGAISDQEGAKAAAAITRLDNLKQGDADYTNALHDARREIFELYNVARAKAGLPPVPYQPHPSRAEGAQPPNAAGATERRQRNGKNYVKIGKDWFEE